MDQLPSYVQAPRALTNVNQPYISPTTVNVSTKAGKAGASSSASTPPVLTPAQREQFVKEWLDLWWKVAPPNEAKLDEQTFRDMFVRPVPGSPRTRPREPAKRSTRSNDDRD